MESWSQEEGLASEKTGQQKKGAEEERAGQVVGVCWWDGEVVPSVKLMAPLIFNRIRGEVVSWQWGWGRKLEERNKSFQGRKAHLFVCFLPNCTACRILAPRPGVEHASCTMEAQSLNHWTARELASSLKSKSYLKQKQKHRRVI